MTVTIVTDSAASLDAAEAARLGVVTVPMQVEIGGRPLGEAEVSLDELMAHIDEGVHTSGPAPGAFLAAIGQAAENGGVLILTVGERLSSTYQSACTAAAMVDDPSQVCVVDTGTAAGAEGLVVLAAARAAAAGASLTEVERQARAVCRRVRLVAAVEHLKYLAHGGRVPAIAARTGERLGVRPVFEMSQAQIHPLRPSLSAEGAREQILNHWRKSRPDDGDTALHVAALHALRPEEAAALMDAVTADTQPETSFIGTFGPVMVAHTGPGVIGLAWWWGSVSPTSAAPS